MIIVIHRMEKSGFAMNETAQKNLDECHKLIKDIFKTEEEFNEFLKYIMNNEEENDDKIRYRENE